eukprot:CAMPEP_0172627770 /NCGR_PEP_ID=MMETSP1068-20121228/158003_1 /TAXON_ID=35684 /ORGANISM="Pseudopedinella elastica, Strain CCMP716" /LENGTH=281 /DNA_ID=CAMNT_0013437761 /DNA_START=143 /DNA_END=988 /DNA_ORIENTATION=-
MDTWTETLALRGVVIFVFSLALSQGLGCWIIHRATSEKQRAPALTETTHASIYAPLPINALLLRSNLYFSGVLTLCCLLAPLGLLVGMLQPALHIEYVVVLFIRKWNSHIRQDLVMTHSIIGGIGALGTTHYKNGNYNAGLAFTILCLVVVAPIVQSLLCILVWFVPMQEKIQSGIVEIIWRLNAFSSAEVFGVAALMLVFWLPDLSENTQALFYISSTSSNTYIGLQIFTAAGFLTTFTSMAVCQIYTLTLRSEKGRMQGAYVEVFSTEKADAVATAAYV